MTKAEKLRIAAEYLEEAYDDELVGQKQRDACCEISHWLRLEADKLDKEAAIRAVAKELRLPVRQIRDAAKVGAITLP